MKIKVISIAVFTTISTLWLSCTANNKSQNSNTADNSISKTEEQIPVQIERLDNDIFEYVLNPSVEKQYELKNKYGDLLEAFGSTVLNNSDVDNSLFFNKIQSYYSNNMLRKIYEDEQKLFQNIDPYKEELSKANYIITQHFENKKLPLLAMHVSGFKENVIATDTIISISADKYLGSNYKIYQNFFENYQLNQMQPQMITRDLLKAWLIYEMPKTNERKTLLSEMISSGKILFALEELLPNWEDTDLIGYTPNQLDWCYQNQKNIWQKTVKQNYLYSTDHAIINKYNADSPFTATISPDSPGRLGQWIGWQIVRLYAQNTGASLEEILNETNAQNILKISKYNP